MPRSKNHNVKETKGIPSGFTRIETGNFPANHDFKERPVLEGKVTAIKGVPQKRGKKTVTVKLIYVADKKTGEVGAVWESKALEELFSQVKVGSTVYIRSEGIQKLKGKKTLKKFVTGIAK